MPIRERIQQRRFRSIVDETVVSLAVAADHLDQATEAVCQRHGITGDQYNVLRILRGVHPGGHSRCEVARRMIHRSPDVTRMLDRLVRQGLVARGRNPEDRRESIATISKAGLALLERMDPAFQTALATFTAPLTPIRLRQLSRLCDALVPSPDPPESTGVINPEPAVRKTRRTSWQTGRSSPSSAPPAPRAAASRAPSWPTGAARSRPAPSPDTPIPTRPRR